MGSYIIDLVCLEHHLIIEVDGSQHAESQTDHVRDAWLAQRGYRVMRFWNNEVLSQTAAIEDAIFHALQSKEPLS
jgi:very-short-patch-repair endonuclease